MALVNVSTGNEPCIIKVSVKSKSGLVTLRLIAFDSYQTETVFTDRIKDIKSSFDFYIRLPQSASVTDVIVYDIDTDNETFVITEVSKMPFEKVISPLFDLSFSQKEFLKFSQQFAYNAVVLKNGQYESDGGRFKIQYYDNLYNEDGSAAMTSFRISIDSGTIQASRHYVRNYTLPVIFFLLWHEYSHVYMNKEVDNELEADLNAIEVYLGLGYPYVDLLTALAVTFDSNRTQENESRWKYCKDYIDNYFEENSNYKNL